MQISLGGWPVFIFTGIITLLCGIFSFYGTQLISKEKQLPITINGWHIFVCSGVIALISGIVSFHGTQMISNKHRLYIRIGDKIKNAPIKKLKINNILKDNLKSKEDKNDLIKKIQNIHDEGKAYWHNNMDGIRSSSVYVTTEMKELRCDTILLLESLGLEDTLLYKEVEKEIDVKNFDNNGQRLFALKLDYIQQHLAVLNSLKKHVESVEID